MNIRFKRRWLAATAGSAALSVTAAFTAAPNCLAQPSIPGIEAEGGAAEPNNATQPLTPDDGNSASDETAPAVPTPNSSGEHSVVAENAPDGENAPNTQQAEALEQGPIHEAFAEPIADSMQPGESEALIDRQPPEPIDEIPPAYKPEGANVEWIPGYWSWFEEKNDFVWVSGVWRALPPGRMWTPGHWSSEGDKYYWVNGFWSEANTQQVEYLPYPPASLEEGPSTAAPSGNHFWIPGCWTYRNTNYAWTPGYWHPGQQNWIWVPNHYSYTPRGAVFVRGYWDYPVERRGLAYAPVYWQNGYQARPGYRYTPNRALNTAVLLSSLFIDNNRGRYFYGDGYRGRDNYRPWYSANSRRGAYSPLYGYYSWQYGRDSNKWSNRFDDRDYARRNYDDRNGKRRDLDRAVRSQDPLVTGVDDLRRTFDKEYDAKQRKDYRQIRELNDSERNQARNRSQQFQRYQAARADFEADGRNVPRAQYDRGDDRDGDNTRRGDRRARFEGKENYRPQKFDLNRVEGNQSFMESNRKRYQQYEQQRQLNRQQLDRQQLDQRRDNSQLRNQRNFEQRNRDGRDFEGQQRQLQQRQKEQNASQRMRRQNAPESPQRSQIKNEGDQRSRQRQSAQRTQSSSQNRQKAAQQSQRGNGNQGNSQKSQSLRGKKRGGDD